VDKQFGLLFKPPQSALKLACVYQTGYVQIFLDHLPVQKGKEDKKKRAACKGKERATSQPQTATSSPALTPTMSGMLPDALEMDTNGMLMHEHSMMDLTAAV
jgi:hypothetical protein